VIVRGNAHACELMFCLFSSLLFLSVYYDVLYSTVLVCPIRVNVLLCYTVYRIKRNQILQNILLLSFQTCQYVINTCDYSRCRKCPIISLRQAFTISIVFSATFREGCWPVPATSSSNLCSRSSRLLGLLL
jgi:hypothetical protein